MDRFVATPVVFEMNKNQLSIQKVAPTSIQG